MYSQQLSQVMQWLVRNQAEVDMKLNSVERTEEYTKLPQEAAPVLDTDPPASAWPSEGAVRFCNLSLRYSPQMPLALNNVSFCAPPRSRVGIVGRTGAGKSTLTQVKTCEDVWVD